MIQFQPETWFPPGCREDTPREAYDKALNRLQGMTYDAESLSGEALQNIEGASPRSGQTGVALLMGLSGNRAWNDLAARHHPDAERDFANLDRLDKRRIKGELYAPADEPQPRKHLKKLKENHDLPLYSLRVGAVLHDSHHRGRRAGDLRDRDRQPEQRLSEGSSGSLSETIGTKTQKKPILRVAWLVRGQMRTSCSCATMGRFTFQKTDDGMSVI